MNNDDQISHIKALSDEVLRKIGRNMLLFQQIEGLLKFLIANHHSDGNKINFMERQQKRAEKVQKQMLGILAEQYIDSILSDAGKPPEEPVDITQPWVTYTFRIAHNNDFYESHRADLKLMVSERNNLIHNFLPQWQPDSPEHMAVVATHLDQQREKVLPMLEHLKSITTSMQQAKELMAAFLISDEGKRQVKLSWLQDSPLVALLRDVATQKARSDGWTCLAYAGKLAREYESDEVTHMKERYEYSTLKQLLVASELFDVWDEPLSNGNFRTLYRAKESLKH